MISVIIPTLNDERTLVPTLAALVPAVVDGIVQEAILSDGGSSDDTRIIADAAGVQLIDAPRGRAAQLEAGAALARGDWLLFLPAGTALEPGWAEEVHGFIEKSRVGGGGKQRPSSVSRSMTMASRRACSSASYSFAASCSRCRTAIRACSSRASITSVYAAFAGGPSGARS